MAALVLRKEVIMKKKIFAIMMCMMLVLAFCVSCGSSGEEAAPEESAEPVSAEAVD